MKRPEWMVGTVATLVLAACSANPGSAGADVAPLAGDPPSRYNLAGYSASFRDGYHDACASPRRRSDPRYQAETDYQMGWNDGASLCRTR